MKTKQESTGSVIIGMCDLHIGMYERKLLNVP